MHQIKALLLGFIVAFSLPLYGFDSAGNSLGIENFVDLLGPGGNCNGVALLEVLETFTPAEREELLGKELSPLAQADFRHSEAAAVRLIRFLQYMQSHASILDQNKTWSDFNFSEPSILRLQEFLSSQEGQKHGMIMQLEYLDTRRDNELAGGHVIVLRSIKKTDQRYELMAFDPNNPNKTFRVILDPEKKTMQLPDLENYVALFKRLREPRDFFKAYGVAMKDLLGSTGYDGLKARLSFSGWPIGKEEFLHFLSIQYWTASDIAEFQNFINGQTLKRKLWVSLIAQNLLDHSFADYDRFEELATAAFPYSTESRLLPPMMHSDTIFGLDKPLLLQLYEAIAPSLKYIAAHKNDHEANLRPQSIVRQMEHLSLERLPQLLVRVPQLALLSENNYLQVANWTFRSMKYLNPHQTGRAVTSLPIDAWITFLSNPLNYRHSITRAETILPYIKQSTEAAIAEWQQALSAAAANQDYHLLLRLEYNGFLDPERILRKLTQQPELYSAPIAELLSFWAKSWLQLQTELFARRFDASRIRSFQGSAPVNCRRALTETPAQYQ